MGVDVSPNKMFRNTEAGRNPNKIFSNMEKDKVRRNPKVLNRRCWYELMVL